jgi:hypothetical protein
MRVQLGDAAGHQGAAETVVEGFGKRSKLRRYGRQAPQCRDVQIRGVRPLGHLAGRQALQRLVEGTVTP